MTKAYQQPTVSDGDSDSNQDDGLILQGPGKNTGCLIKLLHGYHTEPPFNLDIAESIDSERTGGTTPPQIQKNTPNFRVAKQTHHRWYGFPIGSHLSQTY
jgi:hypothetical protein